MGKTICDVCNGDGWYADHSPEHYCNHDLSCGDCGCPIQVQCNKCCGEGWLILNENNLANTDNCDDYNPDSDRDTVYYYRGIRLHDGD